MLAAIAAVLVGVSTASEPTAASEPVAPPKWDCLGGVCLNARLSAPTPKAAVTASERKWTRTVEVCSGRVVKVTLVTGWHQRLFKWTDLVPGTSTPVGSGGEADAEAYYRQVRDALGGKGWTLSGEHPVQIATHTNFIGERMVLVLPADEKALDGWRGWAVGLSTQHPEYNTLCKSKFEQGL